MTMWHGGSGWGWCDTFAHFPWMATLWAVALTGVALAIGFAIGQRSDPAGVGAQPKGAVATRISRDDVDNDDFWRRLM
ncbi:hypothetical protein [Mycobacterium sp. 1245805.9]|uniref:hypothetical protein n=1 Tax=Mycobacterium sp. 1245805.9 TaxID=1856862 RepID=UPI0007FFD74C|nr:hypothetical protein [Mycobacterium sp. 1245805.9]OBI89406.1 hypothetical protein A9X00_21095 [Mycobacterium sp. 1245805.9]